MFPMMKNLIKKLKPFIKRFSAFVAAFLVLVCNFIIPVSAIDIQETTGYNPKYYRPFWNFESIILYFDNDTDVVLTPSLEFFVEDGENVKREYRTLELADGTYVNLSVKYIYHIDSRFCGSVDVIFEADYDIERCQISFVDSFVPVGFLDYHDYSGSSSVNLSLFYNDGLYPTVFPGTIDYYNGSYNMLYPIFSYGSYGSVSSVETGVLSETLLDVSVQSNSVSLTPNAAGYTSYYTDSFTDPMLDGTYGAVVGFSKNIRQIWFDGAGSDSGVAGFCINVPLISPGDNQQWNEHFFDYQTFMEKYFATNSGFSGDFTSWIVTAITGFMAFEILPGVTLTMLLLFVFGISCVFAFLRFFAGG